MGGGGCFHPSSPVPAAHRAATRPLMMSTSTYAVLYLSVAFLNLLSSLVFTTTLESTPRRDFYSHRVDEETETQIKKVSEWQNGNI